MYTAKEVSKLSGVSVRTLHHNDAVGLLPPTQVSAAGYRLYDDAAMVRLQLILLFRELKFPLKDIRAILDSPNFDRMRALEQQLQMLLLQREHIDNLIDLIRVIKMIGVKPFMVDFGAFDTRKLDEYARNARKSWGDSAAWQEYEQKAAGRTKADERQLLGELMDIFREFGAIRNTDPAAPEAQSLSEKLRDFISANFYSCTPEILRGLSAMYAGGGEMTQNIDDTCGSGTAEFAARAIEHFCKAQAINPC